MSGQVFTESEQRLISSLVCQHMPTAALASGMISENQMIDKWVDQLCNMYKYVDRPEILGATAISEWLEHRGHQAGRSWILALRKQWIKDAMAFASRQ